MVTWDLLTQNWDNVTGWTKGGSGISDINPAGQLREIPDNATYVNRVQDIGVLPATYTAEFRLKIDDFGDEGFWTHDFYDGVHRMNFQIFATYVKNADSGQTINIVTTEGVFYVWRLVIDSAGDHIYVYRDTEYLGDTGAGLVYSPGDGTIYATAGNGAGDNFQAHEDFLYIATGLYHWVSDSEDLAAGFTVWQAASSELKAGFRPGQEALDLAAEFHAGQDSAELLGAFIVRHGDLANLTAEFIARQAASQDLPASFDGQVSLNIPAELVVRRSASLELLGEFVVQHSSSHELPASFEIRLPFETLICKFYVRPLSSTATDFTIIDLRRTLTVVDTDREMTVTPRRRMKVK